MPEFTKAAQVGREYREKVQGRRYSRVSTMAAPTEPMAVMSKKRAAEIREESPIRRAWLRYERRCQVKVLGGFAVPPCFGELHVDEIWTRGGGGPTDDPRNFATMCDFHNGWKQQSPEGREFAYANVLLVRDFEGEAWLKAGGRFPGKTAQDLLERIGMTAPEEESE